MPLTCPHCQIVQAEENETCINCGLPLTPAEAAAPPAGDATAGPDAANAPPARRAAWWPLAVIAFGLLLVLAASAFFAARRGVVRRTARSAPALPPPPSPSAPKEHVPPPPASSAIPTPSPVLSPVPSPPTALVPTPKMPVRTAAETPAVPLTITLDSTREGRHVKVGEDVILTALAHGRSKTLTLFYRRGRGKKIMLSFIEGSLCSMPWTPKIAGRYEFTATALGDRQQAAASRRVEITVDEPAPPPVARAEPPQEVPHVAAATPPRSAPRPRPEKTPQSTDRKLAVTYHVAAAKFPSLRNATVLSDALNRLGYQAVPEPMADAHGKAVYVVVTGTYRRPKEARAAVLALQRSGYPAYFFGG